MLDVTSRAVLVVGGGTVAVRKVKGLLAAGATRVTAIAKEFFGGDAVDHHAASIRKFAA